MRGPLVYRPRHRLNQFDGSGSLQAEFAQLGQGVVDGGPRAASAYNQRLLAHVLQGGHQVKSGRQIVVTIKTQAQAVVAFVVVGVVHEDVQYRALEQIFTQIALPVGVCQAQQHSGQRAVAFRQACRRKRGFGRNAMQSQVQGVCREAVKALNRQCMAALAVAVSCRQGQYTGRGHFNACHGGQCHGGMLDERRVHRVLYLAEFDDAGAAIGLQQGFGSGTAQRDTGLHQALDFWRDRGL